MSHPTPPLAFRGNLLPLRKFFSTTLALLAVIALVALLLPPSVSRAQDAKQPVKKSEGGGGKKADQGPVPAPGSLTFNTVITKLKAGKQIFCNTIVNPDLEAAKKACVGQDYIWIEMQHSTLTWRETANLIETIAAEGCIPFVRVPSANAGDIQKATDAGALGIIIPMVSSVQEARNAVMFAKFPIGLRESPNTKPWGHRSSGNNRAAAIWGRGYPTNANNNILIMIQIEDPAGVGLIDNLLDEVEGIDIVMVASNDFGIQAGDRDGSPTYNAREEIVRKSVLAHGKVLAGPSSWRNRPGYTFFQGTNTATTTGYQGR